jgi:hypothetical protein
VQASYCFAMMQNKLHGKNFFVKTKEFGFHFGLLRRNSSIHNAHILVKA